MNVGSPGDLLEKIRRVAQTEHAMAEAYRMVLAPRALSPDQVAFHKQHEETCKKRAAEEAKETEVLRSFFANMRADPYQLDNLPLLAPDKVDGRLYNLWKILKSIQRHESDVIPRVTPLTPFFGPDLAEAVGRALMCFWRPRTPWIRSARPPGKQNLMRDFDSMGITGISLEAEQTKWWTIHLTAEDAALAARYATLNFLGFPRWLDALASSHPDAIAEVLAAEIDAELGSAEDGPRNTLDNLASASEVIRRLVTRYLFAKLKDEIEPPVHASGIAHSDFHARRSPDTLS
jgi:hypothetical protein